MFDLSLHQLLIRVGACVVITSIHGFVLAAIARWLGDRGPQFDGRLTLNPISQFDALGAAAMIFFLLGWIRPIVIDPSKLRLGRFGLVICVFGGITMTLGATVVLLGLRIPALKFMPPAFVPTIIATLNETADMCTWFAVLNLLPLPPLTGMHLLIAARPSLTTMLSRYSPYAAIALAVLLVGSFIQPILKPAHDAVAEFTSGL